MPEGRKKLLVAVVVPVQVVAAVLVWRDLGRRTDAQVRGKKNFWRVFVSLNLGNSLIYWLLGRR